MSGGGGVRAESIWLTVVSQQDRSEQSKRFVDSCVVPQGRFGTTTVRTPERRELVSSASRCLLGEFSLTRKSPCYFDNWMERVSTPLMISVSIPYLQAAIEILKEARG